MADRPPTLDYQDDALLRSIRRGVRLLVLLMLVNTCLIGAGFFAPAINAIAKEQWAAYQKRKAEAATEAARAAAVKNAEAYRAAHRPKVLAAQSQAMTHAWPVGTLAFAEDFAIGSLPAVGTISATLPATRNATTRGSAAAAAGWPAWHPDLRVDWQRFGPIGDADAPLFVHGRRARPEARERLVVVAIGLELNDDGRRTLKAAALSPTRTGDPVIAIAMNRVLIDLPRTVLKRGQSEPPPLRFYAGTPDPLDESAWTIRYEFGLGSGTIAMRLRADDQIDCRVDGPLESIMPSQ